MRKIKIHSKKFLSVLLAVMMILSTAAGSLAAFAANGEWVPVHYTTEYGVARVQLSATGVPKTPGIDIVMVLDTSSSMESYMGTYNNQDVFCEGSANSSRWFYTDATEVPGLTGSSNSLVTNKKSRHDVLQSSLGDFINALNAEGTDGRKRDVQISICDFNGYTQLDKTNDRLKNVTVISSTSDRSQVYTGDKKWDAGSFVSLAELEYVLSYDVYLTGSMEGTREAGSYPTNESAVLYYTNYLEHPCHKDTVSPRLAWEAANISYEFYLVNADGKPVNTAGEVVPFSNRVFVGNIQTNEILLNNTVETNAEIKAADVIPEGYLLYSPDAKYVLKIDSGSTPSEAAIYDDKQTSNGNGSVSTFYYDAGVTYNKSGEIPNVVDYGNTHVAFAVLLVPSIIPDAVVIDYGLPVKIASSAKRVKNISSNLRKG